MDKTEVTFSVECHDLSLDKTSSGINVFHLNYLKYRRKTTLDKLNHIHGLSNNMGKKYVTLVRLCENIFS